MDFGAATHPGYVRTSNEDGFFASRDQAVFAVADGMGGHEQGEVASQLALEAIVQHADAIAHAGPSELPTNLHQALQDANAAILSRAETQDARSRMGTTVVLATICGDRLYFAHIGDSRLYLMRGEMLIQLTRDHSLVQAMVDRGEITPDEAAIHPLRHQITRVVGGDDVVSPEIASQTLEPNDIVLLCTDGLSGAVTQETLKSILTSELTSQQKADALVKAALDAGGPDNVTAVVVAYHRPSSTAHREERKAAKPHVMPVWLSLLIGLGCLLALVAAMGIWEYTHPRYLVTQNTHGMMTLYKRWPLLPMLGNKAVLIRGQVPLTFEDAKPYLREYGDLRDGVKVEGKDAGVMFLQKLVSETTSGLLDQTKTAAEHGDIVAAANALSRARALGADQAVANQLELQIKKAALRKPLPRLPKQILHPAKRRP